MRRIAGTRKKRRNEEAAKNENQDSERHKERRAKIQPTKSEVRVTGILVGSCIKQSFKERLHE
jgi:hypothetical protein